MSTLTKAHGKWFNLSELVRIDNPGLTGCVPDSHR
jgi:hypothetical protein